MKKKVILARCKRRPTETDVRSGLSVTPAQVLKMAEQGIPISAQMNTALSDGHTGSDFNIPLEERRGIDMADIWQQEMTSRKKLKNAHGKGEVVNKE